MFHRAPSIDKIAAAIVGGPRSTLDGILADVIGHTRTRLRRRARPESGTSPATIALGTSTAEVPRQDLVSDLARGRAKTRGTDVRSMGVASEDVPSWSRRSAADCAARSSRPSREAAVTRTSALVDQLLKPPRLVLHLGIPLRMGKQRREPLVEERRDR